MLMWASGGFMFLWTTTRHRVVGLGYGWTMRITYMMIAAIGVVTGFVAGPHWPREIAAIASIVAAGYAMLVSWQRRSAGVSGQRRIVEKRTARVAAMTGIDKEEQRFDTDACLLYTSPSPRDATLSRMPSSA